MKWPSFSVSSFIPGTPGLSKSCMHCINCDTAETGFYTQWWTVSSMLALLAPEYVVHHTDAIHRWIIYFPYLRNYVFGQSSTCTRPLTGTGHCSSLLNTERWFHLGGRNSEPRSLLLIRLMNMIAKPTSNGPRKKKKTKVIVSILILSPSYCNPVFHLILCLSDQ